MSAPIHEDNPLPDSRNSHIIQIAGLFVSGGVALLNWWNGHLARKSGKDKPPDGDLQGRLSAVEIHQSLQDELIRESVVRRAEMEREIATLKAQQQHCPNEEGGH